MLAGEPWCLGLRDIARLTDTQVVRLYIRPAQERAKQLKRQTAGGIGKPVDHEKVTAAESPVPTKEQYVSAGVTMFGRNAEYWAGQYDKLMAGE